VPCINPKNSCHCAKWGYNAIKTGFIDPDRLLFAKHPSHVRKDIFAISQLQEVDELHRVATLFRNHPDYAAPGVFVESIKELIHSRKYKLLSGQEGKKEKWRAEEGLRKAFQEAFLLPQPENERIQKA